MKCSRSALKADRPRIPIITLTSDFGLGDYFVGSLKGVILRALPDAQLIDISHEIPRHDIISGAFVINEAYRYFPPGTIHLVVIDPGVGTQRRKIVVCCERHRFVSPDNGLLSYLLNKTESRVFEIKESALLKFKESPTFAGRDHFAPIAAALASGIDPATLGVEIDDPCKISGFDIKKEEIKIMGKVVYFDHFGNAITNIKKADLPEHFEVAIGREILFALKQNYAEGAASQANLIINSSERLEVFVPRQSAQERLNLKLMDVVVVTETFNSPRDSIRTY